MKNEFFILSKWNRFCSVFISNRNQNAMLSTKLSELSWNHIVSRTNNHVTQIKPLWLKASLRLQFYCLIYYSSTIRLSTLNIFRTMKFRIFYCKCLGFFFAGKCNFDIFYYMLTWLVEMIFLIRDMKIKFETN